jgi:hypothetical protein
MVAESAAAQAHERQVAAEKTALHSARQLQELQVRLYLLYLLYLLYWYKSMPTPAADAQHTARQLQALEVLNLLALLVQKYEY